MHGQLVGFSLHAARQVGAAQQAAAQLLRLITRCGWRRRSRSSVPVASIAASACVMSRSPRSAQAPRACPLLQAYKLLREAAGVLVAARKELLPALAACQAADCHEQLLAALEATALADAQVGRHLALRYLQACFC